MTRFISIISTQQGAGKTTVALNLGLALHRLKQRVLVFDADFSRYNMSEYLGLSDMPITVDDAFSKGKQVHESIYNHASGLKILPSLAMNDYSKIQYHMPEILTGYDFVIADTSTNIEGLRTVLAHSDDAIIVHTPDFSSRHIMQAYNLLKSNKVTPLGIILNKSHHGGVDSIFSIPILAKIPLHKHITHSYTLKQPVLYTHPDSIVSEKFMRLARMIV